MMDVICVILDDEPLAIRALSHVLKQHGLQEVHGFQQTHEAYSFILQHASNSRVLVLADFNLNNAECTGADFLSALPVDYAKCLVSADPTKQHAAKEYGWPFLQKPVRAEQLAKLLPSAHATTSSSTTSSHAI